MITIYWLGYFLEINVWAILVYSLIPAYFIPSIVALWRRHHNKMAIVALNILLGWTIIAWIGAFVWALTAKRSTT